MEQRKTVGLVVLGVAVLLLVVGQATQAAGARPAGAVFTGLAFVVLNPLVLILVLVLMFRRPRGGQQQQQQVVIHVNAGPTPNVQVQCPHCHALNAAGNKFCSHCGKPGGPPPVVRQR
jgi:hypothetical protein